MLRSKPESASVVVPFYNHYPLLHQCLFDLYTHCRGSIGEVVLVDDGSTEEEVYRGLEWWKKGKMLPIRIVETEENVGFLRASNLGIRKATHPVVILLSNDVRIMEDVVAKTAAYLSSPKVMVGGTRYDFDTGWNKFDGKIYPYLEGWYLAMNAVGWGEDVGVFDELFAPHDYEDVDLSTRAIQKGYALVPLDSSKMVHLGAQSIGYSPEREALTKRNQAKFAKKWGHA